VLSFLIVTTRGLPEAYFLARFLESREQRIAILDLAGRPLADQLRVIGRLARRRGLRYLADFLLGRALGVLARQRRVDPFPELDADAVARMTRQHPVLVSRDPHAPEALAFVKEFGPDYILLAGAPVLKPAFYGLARRGALNRHLGLLPEFRGSDCMLWALALDRPESVGFAIHVVAEKVDAGDVIVRQRVPIPAGLSFPEYLARLQRTASEAFTGVLERILRGEPFERQIQMGRGMYFPPAGLSTIRRALRNYARLARAMPASLAVRECADGGSGPPAPGSLLADTRDPR